jgi:hypothetical protein
MKGDWTFYRLVTTADTALVITDTRANFATAYFNATDMDPDGPMNCSEVTKVRIRARLNASDGVATINGVAWDSTLANGENMTPLKAVTLTAGTTKDGEGLYFSNVIECDLQNNSYLDLLVSALSAGLTKVILEIAGTN